MSSSHDHIQGRKEEEGVVSSIKVSVFFFFFLIRKQESFNQICLYVLLLDLNGDYKGNWESANLGKPNEMTVLALAQSGFTSWGYNKVWVCREEVGVMAVGLGANSVYHSLSNFRCHRQPTGSRYRIQSRPV